MQQPIGHQHGHNLVRISVSQICRNRSGNRVVNYIVTCNGQEVFQKEYPYELSLTGLRGEYDLLRGRILGGIEQGEDDRGRIRPLIIAIRRDLIKIYRNLRGRLHDGQPAIILIEEQDNYASCWHVLHLPIHLCLYQANIHEVCYTTRPRWERGNLPHIQEVVGQPLQGNFETLHLPEDINDLFHDRFAESVLIANIGDLVFAHGVPRVRVDRPHLVFLNASESVSPMHEARVNIDGMLPTNSPFGFADILVHFQVPSVIGYLYFTHQGTMRTIGRNFRDAILNALNNPEQGAISVGVLLRNIILGRLRNEGLLRGERLIEDVAIPENRLDLQRLFTIWGLIRVV